MKHGTHGALWLKVLDGFRALLRHTDPELIFRLDADALLIGPGIANAASQRFAREPAVGMLGSYRIGPNGHVRDFLPVEKAIRVETDTRGALRPNLRRYLRDSLNPGNPKYWSANVLGAVSFARPAAVRQILQDQILTDPVVAQSRLCDDNLLSMAIRLAGYELGDFAGPDDPIAAAWRGLPDKPANLVRAGKLATHSTKSSDPAAEAKIIQDFHKLRHSDSRIYRNGGE